ncbi:MAG: 30S ribosome-binding factor RbfA, partial [Myxococcota bacterium]
MSTRIERLSSQLRQEISNMLHTQEIKDPRVGFVTIVGIRVSKDLGVAQVFVSVLGSEDEQEQTMTALHNAQGFIRRTLSKRLHLRRTPEILFTQDHSLAEGFRVNQLLNQISASTPVPESEASGP